jgi:hypothetical protein
LIAYNQWLRINQQTGIDKHFALYRACCATALSWRKRQMRIFRLVHDSNSFQFLLPQRERDGEFLYTFDGNSRINGWQPPLMKCYKKRGLKKGSFYQFSGGVIIVDQLTLDILGREDFDKVGEILPLECEGSLFHLVNITRVVDCLDMLGSEWEGGEPDEGELVHYSFDVEKLTADGLFKIPQTSLTEILLAESVQSATTFRSRVEQFNLKGILFEEI